MPISMKKAKKIQKRCLKVGVYETALEQGVSEETINRYVRMASGQKKEEVLYGESPMMRDLPRIKAQNDRDLERIRREVKSDTRPVLIVPDLHAPYHHPDTIEFLKWVQEWRGCRERIVSVGDMWDFHSMSFHKSEPDALSPEDEYEAIKNFSAEFTSHFPYGDIVLGNHCDIPKRQMVDNGLAPSMLRDNNELYGLPDTWNIHPMYYVIDPDGWDVLVEHGCGSGGMYGCANSAKKKRCSYVQGHTHSNAAVIYNTNHNNTQFGMNVGALIDSSSYAMRYGKHFTSKCNLGCGVVYSGSHAEFVPISAYYEAMR